MRHALQDAAVEVREGTVIGAADSDGDGVEDESTTSREDDGLDDGLADQPDFIVTVDSVESDRPALLQLPSRITLIVLTSVLWLVTVGRLFAFTDVV